jgi:hypothetical protein
MPCSTHALLGTDLGLLGGASARPPVAAAPDARCAMNTDGDAWPRAGARLIDELSSARGRYGLLAGKQAATDILADRLQDDLRLTAIRVGTALAERATPPSAAEILAAIGDASIVADLDVLLWPELDIPIFPFLARLARARPLVAVWPGDIDGGRARYSVPGRPDHVDQRLQNVVVLRPRATRFPDEVPYNIERIAR